MRLISSALLALLMSGSALAATCPEPKDIQEAAQQSTQDGFEGYEYSADKGKWKGFAPNADDQGTKEIQLETLTLQNSREGDKSVICRYQDAKGGALSISGRK
ncbi:hypothetical protein IAE35_08045 [Pseudomonas sp. S75]|uniref:hypothetical protein n=1 Tax=unclassified Pseudomonas TaxID=196821 RepID=UPI00190594CE|nr:MULTISPECIES: hypothetical protein [unclassified Pseudomonas]MBJ9974511.1 hypothetical protein [Pseudomonas sp. S30]MBK0153290.1 hypothetical protein [Pseudomonas sp. S75]